ncbi:hypothetical protein Bca52824_072886 [Brassica carinata]|uniref:Uncharacterized protein n=1 Tax=Brassica carinata TaxID=52824 RepID=A0A8X7Q995_BRACI|nr:hypothetical protein Bca52824_072886 [Brassica carinata]
MDLGFVFTEDDLNSELPEILPGPYLSEAWEFQSDKWIERAEKDSMGLDLRMAMLCGEMNMKDSLKRWARSVASNLR